MAEGRIDAETRTEFGKGAARRTRRAGKIPAVLYGHGTDPQHLALPELEFKRVLREQGRNAVITLNIGGTPQLALTKTVVAHPIRPYIEHIDLLVIRRGEKVVVEVGVIVTGDAAPGHPGHPGAQHARGRGRRVLDPGADRGLGRGPADRHPDPGRPMSPCPRAPSCAPTRRSWWSNVVAAPTEEQLEAELDTEGAGVVEDAPETPADEGDSAAGPRSEDSDS